MNEMNEMSKCPVSFSQNWTFFYFKYKQHCYISGY